MEGNIDTLSVCLSLCCAKCILSLSLSLCASLLNHIFLPRVIFHEELHQMWVVGNWWLVTFWINLWFKLKKKKQVSLRRELLNTDTEQHLDSVLPSEHFQQLGKLRPCAVTLRWPARCCISKTNRHRIKTICTHTVMSNRWTQSGRGRLIRQGREHTREELMREQGSKVKQEVRRQETETKQIHKIWHKQPILCKYAIWLPTGK